MWFALYGEGAAQVSIMDESLNVIGYVINIPESTSRRILTQAPAQRNLETSAAALTVARGEILISIYMKYLGWSE